MPLIPGLNLPQKEIDRLKRHAKAFVAHYWLNGVHGQIVPGYSGAFLVKTAVALCLNGNNPAVQRHVLWHLWGEHGRDFRSLPRDAVMALFRSAEYPVPKDIPKLVTIWRGGRGDPAMLATGYSWSLIRDKAAFFAIFPGDAYPEYLTKEPTLISARVPSSSLIYFCEAGVEWVKTKRYGGVDETSYQEVFPVKAVTSFIVDEDRSDWIPRGLAERQARRTAWMVYVNDERNDPSARERIRLITIERDKAEWAFWPHPSAGEVL